jgi:hypothetical protein
MSVRTHTQARTQSSPTNSLTAAQSGLLQRQCACGQKGSSSGSCDKCHNQEETLQRHATDQASQSPSSAVPPIVYDVLRSSGQPLDRTTRTAMESHFGHDFSQVRVHTDAQASHSAQAVNSLAYTVGRDVVFAQGQYAPTSHQGKRLLAHELAHVVQQGPAPIYRSSLSLSQPGDVYEQEADQAALRLMDAPRKSATIRPGAQRPGTIQRFSTPEHQQIGTMAYAAAKPQEAPSARGPQPTAIDQGLLAAFKESRRLQSDMPEGKDRLPEFQGKPIASAEVYGILVSEADKVASLELLEDQDRERAGKGFRVPVLSRIWDKIGDKTHYLDLAAHNRDHFHPHNFKAWQAWHWSALREMDEAYHLEAQADRLIIKRRELLEQFDTHSTLARKAITEAGLQQQWGHRDEAARLDKLAAQETAIMSRILSQVNDMLPQANALKEQAKALAIHALEVNGFGDHFLTDAYAGGHIVTPRADFLDGYVTKLLGVKEVGSVLHCGSIPSLAWHDLDNKFGVMVKNRKGEKWRTYGDNYANHGAPLGEPTTMGQVVKATSISIRQMWETAAGNKPQSLTEVLDLLPAPELDPAIYPAWTPEDWEAQLQYAAGLHVDKGKIPNQKGDQLGVGGGIPVVSTAVSFAFGCTNALSEFSYKKLVVPMLARIREQYNKRFFTGSEGQVLPPTAKPTPQASVTGHVVLGSVLGGLLGAGIGLAAGGILGAVIGGIVGLLAGGLVGGFFGKRRDQQ